MTSKPIPGGGILDKPRRVLVLFAHPVLEKSRVNFELMEAATDIDFLDRIRRSLFTCPTGERGESQNQHPGQTTVRVRTFESNHHHASRGDLLKRDTSTRQTGAQPHRSMMRHGLSERSADIRLPERIRYVSS